MDIGAKIRDARVKSGLTQEQAAEALSVSRQTISNWENGKTYPDIVSVVRMSDLYDISLDRLLKEERPMSDYLDYLEESTNTVKTRNRLSRLILLAVYLLIWTMSLLAPWFFPGGADAMGYSILYLWVVLPAATFWISLLIGSGNHWGKYKWLFALGFGVMYMLAEYATFSAANMITFNKFNLPEFGMTAVGAAISLIGMGIGYAVHCADLKRKKRG